MKKQIYLPIRDEPYGSIESAVDDLFAHTDRIIESKFSQDYMANANFTFVFFGPPLWYDTYIALYNELADADVTYKIVYAGILQDFAENEGIQNAQIGGIGTSVRISISGISSGSINLSKLKTGAHNVIFLAYSHYVDIDNDAYVFKMKSPQNPSQWSEAPEFNPPIRLTPVSGPAGPDKADAKLAGFWQKIFKYPFGILLVEKGPNNAVLSKVYYENCKFNTRGSGTNAGAMVINEGATVTYERLVPITEESGS